MMVTRHILTCADTVALPRVLLCRCAEVTAWSLSNLSAPFWRLYVPIDTGGVVHWQGRAHHLRPGSAVLIAPHTSASTTLIHSFRKAYVHAAWAVHGRNSLPGVTIHSVAIDARQASSRTALAALTTMSADTLALTLTARLLTALSELPERAWKPHTPVSPAVAQVQAVLDRHRQQPPGNVALGRLVGLHPHSLVRRFTAEVGCAPQAYAMGRRLDEAAERLAASDEAVETILTDLGFHDRSHFTRLFRRRWGCPPAEYRRRQGG